MESNVMTTKQDLQIKPSEVAFAKFKLELKDCRNTAMNGTTEEAKTAISELIIMGKPCTAIGVGETRKELKPFIAEELWKHITFLAEEQDKSGKELIENCIILHGTPEEAITLLNGMTETDISRAKQLLYNCELERCTMIKETITLLENQAKQKMLQ